MFLRGECRAERSIAFAYYDDIVCVAHWAGDLRKGLDFRCCVHALSRCVRSIAKEPATRPLSGDGEPQLELYALAVSAVSGRCAAAVKFSYLPHDIKAQPEMRLMLRALLAH